jgi:hypothetical protein
MQGSYYKNGGYEMITFFVGLQTVCVGATTIMAIKTVRAKRARREVNLKLVSKDKRSGFKYYKPKTNIGGF